MAERIRGTAPIPLTSKGEKQIKLAAELLKKLGGLQQLYHSDLKRCVQTAGIISDVMPGCPVIDLGSRLDPWHLGKFEGMEVDKVRDDIQYYVYHPDEVVPGTGFAAPGESFDCFKIRFLSCLEVLYKRAQTRKIGIVANYRTLTLSRAWAYAGANHDYDIVTAAMFDPTVTPGDILHICSNTQPGCGVMTYTIDDNTHESLQDGLYIIRHGETAWNSSGSDQQSGATGS
jgi:broad specificity phosphatase PhoE